MEHKDIFIEEVNELLEQVEYSLIDVEDTGFTIDIVNTLFRSFHTMKGSAAMLGLDVISNLTHKIEDLLEPVREGVIDIEIYTTEYVDVIFKAKDQLSEYLNCIFTGQEITKNTDIDILIEKLKSKISNKENKVQILSVDKNNIKNSLYNIILIPTINAFNNGIGISNLLIDLKENGEVDILVDITKVPNLT